ncbi:MAG: recombinase family protein [Candidatus Rokuibacteriota bacterium]
MMLSSPSKVTSEHLRRDAYLYVRQSSLQQVHDHRESTARQYDLKRQAQALGWSSEHLVVIDEDQGLSGASAAERNGFQRLVAEVGLGRVGLVMGLEVSRLARNSSDWHRLLEICALAETLILDEDGIYDPSHFNDRLLLGLKGTMSEAELHVLRARLIGGSLNKARRGELWIRPPMGFVYEDRGRRLVLDPDAQIQGAVRLLFETYRRTGSAEQVVRHFAREGLRFPRRLPTGPRAGEVVFIPLVHSRVLNLLHNPRYAGAFVYGRTRQRRVVIPGQQRNCRRPRAEWPVFLPNAHPGYITWEEFETNQATLLANANGYGPDRRRSPAREGVALLQGLVLCGRCGDRMTVRYTVSQGHPAPVYVCQRQRIARAEPACQTIPGTGLDAAVAQVVLEAVTPAALDVALEVFAELRARKADVDRLRRAQVERAREEAALAQRQFLLVRPEHRLVADSLERQWNEKLARLADAEREYRRVTEAEGRELTADDCARIHALASDLPRVWHDPRTAMRERKRMLRLLIEDVTLLRDRAIRIAIRWKGGATTTVERPVPLSAPALRRTSAAIVEMIRGLAAEQTDRQVATTLNRRWLRSGTGQPFHRLVVRHIRNAYGIPSLAEYLRNAGWLTAAEISTQLRLHSSTAKCWAREGVLRAVRADDKGFLLFEPPTGPLPRPQQGKRFRDRRRYPQCASHMRNEVQYEA